MPRLDNMKTGTFHFRDGMYFIPEKDGSVTIKKFKDGKTSTTEVEFEINVDADSWQSVVCSMAGKDENILRNFFNLIREARSNEA